MCSLFNVNKIKGANSPYAGVAIALFIPLLLAELAEEYGCNQTNYGCDIDINDIETGENIQVWFGAIELKPASYAAAIISISSAMQCAAYFFTGSIADFEHYRTRLFRITAISGGIVTCCYIFWGNPLLWQFAGWWTVLLTILHWMMLLLLP